MIIHILIALISVILGYVVIDSVSLSQTLLSAALSLISLGRLIYRIRLSDCKAKLLLFVIPGLMWLWYFSPSIIYTFDTFYLNDFLIFDEVYLARSMMITAAYFCMFLGGVESYYFIKRKKTVQTTAFEKFDKLTFHGLVAVSIMSILIGILVYGTRPQQTVQEYAIYIDTYSDPTANADSNSFSSVVVVWAMFVSLIIRNIIGGSSINWLLSSVPGLLALVVGTSSTGRRQAVIFAAIVLIFPLLLSNRRRNLVVIAIIVSSVVAVASVIDFIRSSKPMVENEFRLFDLVERPLINFANTTSFHARSLWYYEESGVLFGESLLVDPTYAIPFGSRLFGSNRMAESYNQAPVHSTVDFAMVREFGMGGSLFSELHANFGIFGIIFAFGVGLLYAKWSERVVLLRGNISSVLIGSVLLLMFVWMLRSSLQSSVGMLRFVFIGAAIGWIIHKSALRSEVSQNV